MRRRKFFRAALGALAATPLVRFLPSSSSVDLSSSLRQMRVEYVPESGAVGVPSWDAFLGTVRTQRITYNLHSRDIDRLTLEELEDELAWLLRKRLAKQIDED